jgi:hypothetical protein
VAAETRVRVWRRFHLGRQLQNSLGIDIVELVQRGDMDAVFEIVTPINGSPTTVKIGTARAMLTPRALRASLLEHGVTVSAIPAAMWEQVLAALNDVRRVVSTESDDEGLARLIRQMEAMCVVSITAPGEEDARALADEILSPSGGVIRDGDGRIAIVLETVMRQVMAVGDRWHKQELRGARSRIGFTYERISLTVDGKRRQPRMWISGPGFMEDE